MNREERRAWAPVLRRFEEDLDSGHPQLRYDPSADILSLVIYRPSDAITVQDHENDVFLDFDPELRRISAITILQYRKLFLPGHVGGPRMAFRSRLAWRVLLFGDWALSKLGINLDRYWDDLLQGKDAKTALAKYRAEIKEDSSRFGGTPPAMAFA